MVRGSLVSLIYAESLALEDQNDDLSAAVTLMSTDVDRICQSLVLLHDLWARPLELAVGIGLLARQIGWVCVMPVAVVLLSALADTQVTRSIGGRVKVWTDAVQHRISWTGDVLTSMKSVKIIGFAGPLSTLLQNERVHELRLQAKFRWSSVLLNTFGKARLLSCLLMNVISTLLRLSMQATTPLEMAASTRRCLRRTSYIKTSAN